MSQNHPMMPQKRPKIRTPQHRGCGVLLRRPHTPFAEVSCPVCAPCSPCWWLRSLSPPSPVPTAPAESRLADSLFEVEVRPNVGRHVRQAVFATLPPPSEPDVIPPI